jgi:hypothetical protein
MRKWPHLWSCCALSALASLGLAACAAKAPVKVADPYAETPVPTVPPTKPTPEPTAAPLPTHPIGTQAKPRKGEIIGPVITYFGAARADGTVVESVSVDKKGIPTFKTTVGSGFMLVVEAKPGKSGYEPGRRIFAYVPDDPHTRPDLEIESNHDMGDGNPAVCDRRRPNIGGIPGIDPPSFAETQHISDAINDFGCRFETFIESESSCTMSKNGDYSFASKDTTTQFCMIVARSWAFPEGKTLVSVRLRDSEGNPGPVKQLWIERSPAPKTPKTKKQK